MEIPRIDIPQIQIKEIYNPKIKTWEQYPTTLDLIDKPKLEYPVVNIPSFEPLEYNPDKFVPTDPVKQPEQKQPEIPQPPEYKPEVKEDKEFFIEPYLQLNIHEGSNKEIYIDEGEKLSELNRWKFNALKLDYLIRELIKLGAKNNETLDVVLDLHEDIKLDKVSEWYKDIAGVPSTFTNIT